MYFIIATTAIIASVTFTNCGSSKKVAQTQTASQIDQEIALKKKQMELEKLNAEIEMQKQRLEMQKADVEAERAAKEQEKPKMLSGNTRIIIPCVEELIDKPGEYMSGLGVSQGNTDIKDANINGILAAKADIEARFIGTVKSSYDYYTKQVNVPSGKKMKESELEGLIGDLIHKIVDKEAFRVCGPEVQQEALGGFTCFAVYRIYMKALDPVADKIADKMEVLGVDFDKRKYKEAQEEAFKADAAKREAEMKSGSY